MTRLLLGGQLTRALWLGLELNPADAWLGAFGRREACRTELWICLLPMLPLHIAYQGRMEAPHDPE